MARRPKKETAIEKGSREKVLKLLESAVSKVDTFLKSEELLAFPCSSASSSD